MQPEISISIINTNNRDITLQCLESVYATAGQLDLEIIVVNNACTDGSAEAIRAGFPQVRLIENPKKLGFSTNNNLAFGQSCGRYLMLLNDDTIVHPGAFQAMVAFMDSHPEAGVVGASMLNPDGSPQQSYMFDPHPFYDGFQPISEKLFPLPKANGLPLEIPVVHGACMMVRASAAQKVGLLDTRFDPLYSEEVDWCHRFRKAGWRIYHLPEAHVVHLGGATMNRIPVKRYELIFTKKALFFRKHYGWPTVALYKALLFVINLLKSAIYGLQVLLGRKEVRADLETHWNMTRRALFL